MKVYNTAELGSLVRKKRKELSLTQAQLADACGRGTRFVSDLENGKPTMQIGQVISLLNILGLDVQIIHRGD